MTLIHSLWTVAALVVFVAIIGWAFSRKRRADFERAARLPLEDDDVGAGKTDSPSESEGKKNG